MEKDERGQDQEKRAFVLFNPLWSIRQRIILVLIIGIAGSVLIASYAAVYMKPRYSAEGLLNLNPYLPKILYKSEESDYIHSFEDWVRTQVNIIKSHPVIEHALKDYEQQGFYWTLPGETLQASTNRLAARLKIVQVRDTQTISISLVSSTKKGLPELINSIIRAYIQNTRDKSEEENATKLTTLKREHKKIKQELEEGYSELEKISRKHGTAITDEKYLYMYIDKLNDLKRSYNKAFLDEATARNRIIAFDDMEKPRTRENPEAGKDDPPPARAVASPDKGERNPGPGIVEVKSGPRTGASGPGAVSVELTGPTKVTAGTLSNPKKFFVHLWNTSLPSSVVKELTVDSDLLGTVSMLPYGRNKVRVLFQMKTDKYRFEPSLSENPAVLTVRLSPSEAPQKKGVEIKVHDAVPSSGDMGSPKGTAAGRKEEKAPAVKLAPSHGVTRVAAARGTMLQGGSGKDGLTVAIFNDPELMKQEMSLREQMVGLAEDHPKHLYLKEKLQLLYDQARTAYMARMSVDYKAAESNKAVLAKEVERVQDEMLDYNTAVIRVTSKKQEIDRLQNTLNRINERIDQILVESATPGRIIVQSWALPPESPSADQRGKMILVGIIGSFAFAAFVPVGIDLLKNTVQRAMDLEKFLGFPLTGFVIDSVHDGIEPRDVCEVFRKYPSSFLFDRYVSTGLRFEKEHAEHGSRLFTFFPVSDGNGSTALALNVLASLDAPAERKLYIDLNLRNPLTALFPQFQKDKGITDWLKGTGDLGDYVRSHKGFPYRFIQLGSARNPLPIMMNLTRVEESLNALKEHYDYIFVDAPPLLISTDTRGMVRISDVTVVVVEANKSTWPVVKKTMTLLEEVGMGVVAVVLNRVKILKSGHLKEQMETFYRGREGHD